VELVQLPYEVIEDFARDGGGAKGGQRAGRAIFVGFIHRPRGRWKFLARHQG
jgi:hypothetical protein